jgi:hypothetical protein
MRLNRQHLSLAILVLYALPSRAESELWTTGPASMVFSEGGCGCFYTPPTYSGFGYISGRIDAASPQRWAAVPFQLDDPAHITRLDAYYSDPSATKPTSVEYIIWNRAGLAAPTSIAASGTLGPYVSYANEGSSQYNPTAFLHQHDLDLSLPAGDYYLTIYGSGTPGKTAWIAWWSGGNQQNPALEQNFIWRSASYPSPGFQHYSYTGSSNLLADPKDVYNLAFALYGTEVPEPSSLALIVFGSMCVIVRVFYRKLPRLRPREVRTY